MELLRPTDRSEEMARLLGHLAEALESGEAAEDVQRAAAVSTGDPLGDLARALPRIGLRASWIRTTPRQAAERARPDLPLVIDVGDGLARGWLVLDGWHMGRVRLWSTSVWLPSGWCRVEELEQLLAGAERTWARIEATLPASSIGGTTPGASPVARLGRLLRVERDAVGVVLIYGVAVGVLSLATPLAIQVLINWLAFGGLYQPVVVLAGALLLCLALAAALQSAQRFAVELVQRRLFARTVTEVGARLARVRISELDGVYGPELANRFFDVLTLQKAAKTLLVDGLTASLQAAVGLLLLAVYHPYLLVFDIAVIGLAALALVPFLRRGQDSAIAESKAKYAVAAWIEEIARNPLVFKLGGLDHAETRLEQASLGYLEARDRHFRAFFGQYLGMQAVQVIVQVGLLLTCGWLVLEGQLTLGQLVAAEFIVASALAGLTKFTDKLETVYDLLAGVDKLGALMDLSHDRPRGALPRQDQDGADYRLASVGFRWGTDTAALDGLSLELPAGSRVAVLGRDGLGKSALADVLAGLRDPQSGVVWRDGMPLTELLREPVFDDTLLLRGRSLLHASIRENLALGRPGVDDEIVWEALRAVELAETVAALPEGLDTVLAPSGAPLSESGATALLVARALVAPRSLVIVDGVLDGITPTCRDTLISALRRLSPMTTLVVLTEDPTTAFKLPRIYELRDGGLHARPRLSPV